MIHGVIPTGERHAPHNWEYANATARTAASGFVSADLNKLALQLDDGTYWRLSAISPVTWGAVGGSSSGGGGTATIIQETGTLDQGYTLVVSHSADADFKRLVSVIEHLPTASSRVNPILSGDSANATASSSYSSAYAPWKAFKNDSPDIGGDTNFWETLFTSAPHWIAWNFGAPTAIAGVRFHSFSAVSMPSTATVQGSNDGTTWTDVATITPPTTHPSYQTYAFTTATYQRWRLYFPVNSSRTDIILGGLAWLSPATESARNASAADYSIEHTATTTRVTRLASGSKQITVNVLIG